MATHNLVRTVKTTIDEYKMLDGAVGVLAALSGGADSTVMLYIMHDICASRKISLRALHVNHCIRGEEADRDEKFCLSLCEKLNIPLIVKRVDVPSEAAVRKIGLEAMARELRYTALGEARLPGEVIATAHNASDNAETTFFNLIRGAGSRGMAGIQPVRDGIIRPLLYVGKDEIIAYAASCGIEYVTDSTNADTNYTRNFLRHEIIPRAKEINPSLEQTILNMGAHLREDDEYLSSIAQDFIKENTQAGSVSLSCFAALAQPLKYRVIAAMSASAGVGALTARHIDAVLQLAAAGVAHSSINLPAGVRAVIEEEQLSFTHITQREISAGCEPYRYIISPGINSFSELGFEIMLLSEFSPDYHRNCENIYKLYIFDKIKSDKIRGDIFIRARQNGDTYRTHGMTHSVKRLLSDKKMPLSLRARLPVLCHGDDIVWLPGFGVADEYYPAPGDEVLYVCYGRL